MSELDEFGLTTRERGEVARIVAISGLSQSRIVVFGSRATGSYRRNSDLDLAVLGDVDDRIVRRLRTEFIESDLGISVDIVAHRELESDALRSHIDRVGRPLGRE